MRGRGVQLIVAVAAALLLASGVAMAASFVGTEEADTITGTFNKDTIKGLAGDDTINAASGDDTVYGEAGNDLIDGAFNNDIIDGGTDDDTLYGGFNKDKITGGPGVDKIRGDSEADSIYADDGEVDFINCGTGTDTATANAYADGSPMDKNSDAKPLGTTTSSCETINWVKTSTPPIETTPSKFTLANYCTVGQSGITKITITNKSTTNPITLYPLISGRDKNSFSVPTDPIYIASGASKDVSVTFTTPSISPGQSDTWTGSLALKDGSNKAVAAVPLSAACTA